MSENMGLLKVKNVRGLALNREVEMLDLVFDLHLPDAVENQEEGTALEISSNVFYELYLDIMTPEISRIVGERVVPSYAFARRYYKDSYLSKHIDRASCVYTITLTLNGSDDKPWPIWYELDGIENGLENKPGDAAVIRGCEVYHWRNKLESDYKTQLFLHYVPDKEEYQEYFFDGREKLLFDQKHISFQNVAPSKKREFFYESSMDALKAISKRMLAKANAQ